MIYVVENMPDTISYEVLDRVIVFACDYLGILYETNLEIEFDDELETYQYGISDIEDGVAQLWLNPSLEKEDLIITIFHEMVHIRQILNGDLVIGEGKEKSKWRGVSYNDSYQDTPWEKEAFEHEKIMLEGFGEEESINNKVDAMKEEG